MTPNVSQFGKLVPGFDFLQGLVKNAGAALPGLGQWIAPTLNPEELEKRIEELRTVQFWLEQNARMLGATIQALEVQRMTLSTLKSMNVPVDMLRDSLQAKPDAAALNPFAAAAAARPEPAAEAPAAAPAPAAKPRAKKAEAPAPAVPAVDPMQWWGALTQQFTDLAANAMKDVVKEGATEGAKALANELVKQSFNAAGQTLKAGMAPVEKAARMAGEALGSAAGCAGAAGQAAGGVARGAASVAKAARKAPAKTARKAPAKRAR